MSIKLLLDSMALVNLIGTGTTVAFNSIVLSWVLKIEKQCDCSKDWRREYIKYFSIISIAFSVLQAVSRQFFVENVGKILMSPLLPGVLAGVSLFMVAGLVNMGSMLTYIPSLKKRKCNCARQNDWRDDFIFWFMVSSLVLSAVFLLGLKIHT
jgi:hypothetical protein